MQAIETSGSLVGVVCLAGLVSFLIPQLRMLGIVPRTLPGLLGIVFCPLLHVNLAHLLANVLPLFVLLVLLFWDRHYHPDRTLACIWLASGFGTWLIGRGGAVHLGASSIVFGLVTYLVAAGFFMRSWRSAFMALLVFVLYGGVMYGILPQHGPVSWEGHLCGALAGIWAAHHQHG
jgi:membrane associated rhomboid family serine protease